MFKKGDKVKRKNGVFSNDRAINTVDRVGVGGRVYLVETGTWVFESYLELVESSPLEETNDTLISRPDSEHYTDSGIDVWQFANANFDYDELFGFHRINVIKYITRFGKKNGRNIRDLEKAKAVIEEMIRMEVEGE